MAFPCLHLDRRLDLVRPPLPQPRFRCPQKLQDLRGDSRRGFGVHDVLVRDSGFRRQGAPRHALDHVGGDLVERHQRRPEHDLHLRFSLGRVRHRLLDRRRPDRRARLRSRQGSRPRGTEKSLGSTRRPRNRPRSLRGDPESRGSILSDLRPHGGRNGDRQHAAVAPGSQDGGDRRVLDLLSRGAVRVQPDHRDGGGDAAVHGSTLRRGRSRRRPARFARGAPRFRDLLAADRGPRDARDIAVAGTRALGSTSDRRVRELHPQTRASGLPGRSPLSALPAGLRSDAAWKAWPADGDAALCRPHGAGLMARNPDGASSRLPRPAWPRDRTSPRRPHQLGDFRDLAACRSARQQRRAGLGAAWPVAGRPDNRAPDPPRRAGRGASGLASRDGHHAS